MEFGKLKDISKVDFSMGTVHPNTTKLLKRLPATSEKTNFYFGCTGWGMKEWLGKYYPQKAKTKEYLYHYSRQFSTIELNTTHYRIPTAQTIQNWYDLSAKDFKFAPKIPQSISHSNDLGAYGNQIDLFCASITGLKEKLGTSFMQLPPNFGPNRMAILEQFLSKFPTDEVPLAIEVRAENWFKDEHYFQLLLNLLASHDVGTVITDVAGRRDVLHLGLTTPSAMIRFVGNGLHPTDYERVDEWIDLLVDWMKQGLREIYFFSHQPDNILSPEMCIYLIEQLERKSDLRFSIKTKPIDDGQMTLF
ncbi:MULTISPECIES: DUF72 domain-containing protein [unclassified Aureispira]|uniref:DUF72 domain-containing protein n=1 Tax=unclassified Aureispira TaxID=2649989 RepID=UPI0006984A35|nr:MULTISPECIES: DUF72 domain-containing protein [unclassified Aureispira]WMX12525.1 DUF72 domain-containing protein [Aureispira sp. CCB-E]